MSATIRYFTAGERILRAERWTAPDIAEPVVQLMYDAEVPRRPNTRTVRDDELEPALPSKQPKHKRHAFVEPFTEAQLAERWSSYLVDARAKYDAGHAAGKFARNDACGHER